MMWPFKWKLSACTFTWCYLFLKIWKFGRNLPLATFGSERVKLVSQLQFIRWWSGTTVAWSRSLCKGKTPTHRAWTFEYSLFSARPASDLYHDDFCRTTYPFRQSAVFQPFRGVLQGPGEDGNDKYSLLLVTSGIFKMLMLLCSSLQQCRIKTFFKGT